MTLYSVEELVGQEWVSIGPAYHSETNGLKKAKRNLAFISKLLPNKRYRIVCYTVSKVTILEE